MSCIPAQPENRDGDARSLDRSKQNAEDRGGENRRSHRRRPLVGRYDKLVTLFTLDSHLPRLAPAKTARVNDCCHRPAMEKIYNAIRLQKAREHGR